MGFIADKSVERHNGAILGATNLADIGRRIDRTAHQLENIIIQAGGRTVHRGAGTLKRLWRCHGRLYPPLTGGRKAISSPPRRAVLHEANSWVRDATREAGYRASSGIRATYSDKRFSMEVPSAISMESSPRPRISFRRPKNSTLTRKFCETLGTIRL